MPTNGRGYRPSVIFIVTVLMLLVALACVIVWIDKASEVSTEVADARQLQKELKALRDEFETLRDDGTKTALTLGEHSRAIDYLNCAAPPLGEDLDPLRTRLDKLERLVGGLEAKQPSYRTATAQDAIDEGLRTQIEQLRPAAGGVNAGAIASLERRLKGVEDKTRQLERRSPAPSSGASEAEIRRLASEASLGALPVGPVLPLIPPDGTRRLPPLPDGWEFCDGRGGRPNLNDRVLMGTTSLAEAGNRGGDSETGGAVGHHHHSSAWDNPKPSGPTILVAGSTRRENAYWFSTSRSHTHAIPVPPHVKVLYIIRTE